MVGLGIKKLASNPTHSHFYIHKEERRLEARELVCRERHKGTCVCEEGDEATWRRREGVWWVFVTMFAFKRGREFFFLIGFWFWGRKGFYFYSYFQIIDVKNYESLKSYMASSQEVKKKKVKGFGFIVYIN